MHAQQALLLSLTLLQHHLHVMATSNCISGTRDFHPDEMRLRSWLFDHMAAVSRVFAFEQVDAPVLESEELFVRKAGEEITEQLYNFEVSVLQLYCSVHHKRIIVSQ